MAGSHHVEVPLLAVISELVHRYRSPEMGVDQALNTLEHKLGDFATMTADLDMSAFRLMDFGTRRRFSREVQEGIVRRLQQEPWFVGTSNYDLARRLNLTPMGTRPMSGSRPTSRSAPALPAASGRPLPPGWKSIPDQLGIALTDCITMDAFLRDFGPEFATRYQGLRHDSGDPVEWGEKAIAHYQKLGIDPLSKVLVFSDNLDLAKAVDLYRHFASRVKLSFGIGTRLTCDLPQVKPLNIVIKLVECNGKPVAKLSDSPGKTICHDKAFVRALREAFDLPPIKKAS
ncbi:nicotinate phosphoribosyltransferase [Klebsiella pneumoniae]|nr:nicotinate phosphoribosyltransferase [Klebsiella pneumoniae]